MNARALRRLVAVSAACASLTYPANVGVATADPIVVCTDTVCLEFDPECTIEDQTVLLDSDDGRTIDLDVLVLLDGVTTTAASAVLADAAIPYAELDITVVPTYQSVSPPFTGTSAPDIIDQAKRLFPDQKVPAEYDVVQILTTKSIEVGALPVAGLADCIGGVADDRHAFAVSETTGSGQTPAKAAAHEIGHLLGGQHHYANCVEGIPPVSVGNARTPCTLMFNDVALISLRFSTVNGRVARGYALRHATANDTP